MKKLILALCAALFAPHALAVYDIRDLHLGSTEAEVRKVLPSAHCKVLEWKSKAADRRCDDSRVVFGGVEMRVTFYLKKDQLEAFDVRFDTKELDRFVSFLKTRYGKPTSESRDEYPVGSPSKDGKGERATRKVYKALWERDGERAALTAQMEKRTGSMLVTRGAFDEEIYRVQ